MAAPEKMTPKEKTFVSHQNVSEKQERKLTDHVDGGSSRPRPMMLLDGVVERGLTQLNGSHTDPEAQAEQPGHDRTHLLRTGRGGVKNTSCSQRMTSKYTHTLTHKHTIVLPES